MPISNLICKCCGKEYQTRHKPSRSKYCSRLCSNRSISKRHCKTGSKIHIAWASMKDRCLNPRNKKYYNYGGRGITVCEKWMDFENFYKDMGDPPFARAHLDRIDNDQGYSPENCRWVSNKENAQNTRRNLYVTHEGKKMCLAEGCRKAGLKFNTVRGRSLRYLIDIQIAFDISITTPRVEPLDQTFSRLLQNFLAHQHSESQDIQRCHKPQNLNEHQRPISES